MPTASYHAWLATFNAAGSALQSNMQSFAQRYSQSNSTFDQLNKVLSGVISTLGDSAREVYKSIG
ncbi:Translocator protein bipD [Erwinia amylovora Ea266]|nr:Translocator protein bipD [Erwinia amylovora Ea266]